MTERAAVIAGPEEGEALWFGGGLFTIKVDGTQSGGAFLLVEDTAHRGKTTPLHIHPDHDETFFIIEGELLLHVDGEEYAASAGYVASIPRGTPHAFLVTSEAARFLALVTPGSAAAEAFFRDGGEPAPSRTAPPPDSLDIPKLIEVGKRTGAMEVLGPPPFAQAQQPSQLR